MKPLLLFLVIFTAALKANAFCLGGLYYYPLSNGECEVRGFDPTLTIPATTNLIIPAYANDGEKSYKVTRIAEEAFCGYPEIVEVNLPPTLTTIGRKAFSSCVSLKEMIVPSGVTEIGEKAFFGCVSMTHMTTSAEIIGLEAFSACYSLAFAMILPGTRFIEPGAFDQCVALTYIEIPYTVERIGCGTGYLEHVGAFERCTALKTVTFTFNLSDKIPRLKRLGCNTFKSCVLLERLDLPYSVTTIGTDALRWCFDLKHLEWGGPEPLSVGKIDLDEVPLKRIVFHGDVIFDNASDFEKLVDLAEVRYDTYATTVQGKLFANLPSLKEVHLNHVDKIGFQAFMNCSALSKITMHPALSRIEYGAFQGCTSLKAVEIPECVTELSQDVFNGCSSLSDIRLSENLESIHNRGFKGCSSLQSLILPKSLTYCADDCLSGCTSLKDLTIGGKTLLTLYGFAADSPIERLTLRGNVSGNLLWPTLKEAVFTDFCTQINSNNFYGCTQLQSVNLSPIKTIGANAFYGCTSLESVDLSSVVDLGGYAFNYCTSLSSVKFGNEITEIPTCLDNSGVISLDIPDNVTSFRAPTNCPKLTTVKIGAGVKYVGSFDNCPLLSEICYGVGTLDISTPESLNLSKITSLNLNPPSVGWFYKEQYQKATLLVPAGALERYRTTAPWSGFFNIKEIGFDNVEDISTYNTCPFDLKVDDNIIHIRNVLPALLYDSSCKQLHAFDPGTHQVELSSGIYIFTSGNVSRKLIIR